MKLYGPLLPEIQPGDMETIKQPLDYLGLNMYRRSVISEGTDLAPVNIKRVNPPGEYSDMGWEITPKDCTTYSNGLTGTTPRRRFT